jgi:hypothetical protein
LTFLGFRANYLALMKTLIQVTSSRFVAGFIVEDGRVSKAAPILRKLVMGLPRQEAVIKCLRKGYKLVIIGDEND